VTVTVQHDALPVLTSNAQSIVVADQQITVPVAAGVPAAGLEGAAIGPISSIATFTDPAGVGVETAADFVATIVWGDGTTSTGTVVSDGGGAYHVDAPDHTYVEEGSYTVTVTVRHDALRVLTINAQTIMVADQQITNLADAN
jgi:PKD repeat protein